jgi:hypothetical protein
MSAWLIHESPGVVPVFSSGVTTGDIYMSRKKVTIGDTCMSHTRVTSGSPIAGEWCRIAGAMPPECLGHHQGTSRAYFQSDCLKVSCSIFGNHTSCVSCFAL